MGLGIDLEGVALGSQQRSGHRRTLPSCLLQTLTSYDHTATLQGHPGQQVGKRPQGHPSGWEGTEWGSQEQEEVRVWRARAPPWHRPGFRQADRAKEEGPAVAQELSQGLKLERHSRNVFATWKDPRGKMTWGKQGKRAAWRGWPGRAGTGAAVCGLEPKDGRVGGRGGAAGRSRVLLSWDTSASG